LGFQSDVGAITNLLIKHVRNAFVSDKIIDSQWQRLNFRERPDLARAIDEYDRLVELLTGFDIDLHYLPKDERVGLDSLYIRDTSIVCNKGVILCNMGKVERSSEPAVVGEACRALDLPIHGAITGPGTIEGGDVVWLDQRTLAVGRGYRTNEEGIRQLRELLTDSIDELIIVHLPHWRGSGDVFHLMSILSPIDYNLALVYSPLLSVPFREVLLARGMELIEVPDSEFETMSGNVLTVAPRKCVMLAGNPQTKARLERKGVEVVEFVGEEICIKGGGGPTCLTRPLLRVLRKQDTIEKVSSRRFN
ncbi:MAG: dimethylarginine dimethylaminohydrolase family protein, partial [bacterium]